MDPRHTHPLATLAQMAWGDPSAVRPLQPAPPLERWVLEQPWPLVGLCLVGAMLCLVVLRPRIKGSIPLVGAGLLGLIAAGLGIAGTLLATDRERLRARSVELIDAVARVDAGSMSAIFAPGVRLQTGLSIQQVPRVVGRDALVDAVERTLGGPFAVKEHAVLEVQAQLDGRDVARTQVRVRATPSSAMYQVPAFSWWRLDWRRSDQTWELTSIEPLAIWFAGHDLRR